MLLRKRDIDAVVRGSGLQFEIEGTAESFAQRQSPSPVNARSERGMNHQLHSARFIEESLGHDGLLGW